MFESIKACHKCNLCLNQAPLLDKSTDCQIFWVGLSAKIVSDDTDIPLSPETNTGQIIYEIEETYNDIISYKTNLVKCVPLTESKKLRYPNKSEINCCIIHLQEEIHELSPKIVFLLGEKVCSSVEKQLCITFEKWNGFNYIYKEINGVYYIPIHHPSYIYVYKRKQIQQYVKSIQSLIDSLL